MEHKGASSSASSTGCSNEDVHNNSDEISQEMQDTHHQEQLRLRNLGVVASEEVNCDANNETNDIDATGGMEGIEMGISNHNSTNNNAAVAARSHASYLKDENHSDERIEKKKSRRRAKKPSNHQLQLRKQINSSFAGSSSSRSHSRSSAPVVPRSSRTASSLSDSSRSSSYTSRRSYQNDYFLDNDDTTKQSNCNTSSSKRKQMGWNSVETKGGIAPCQRSLHTSSVLNGNLYIFGGYDGQSRINDFHGYSFRDKTWAPIIATNPQNAPSPRDRHISVVYQNSIYIFGGFDGTSRVNDFYGFDFSTMRWNAIHPQHGTFAPSPRHSHSAVVYKDSLYVFGGYDGSYRSDFHQFHFPTGRWSAISPHANQHQQPHHHHNNANGRQPRARYRATCTVHEPSHCMLLFGGHDGSRHLSDTHVFDFEQMCWLNAVHTEGVPPIPRDSHVSAVYEDSMYIFGGSTGSAMNDLYELKLDIDETSNTLTGAKWSPVIGSTSFGAPGHRFCHSAAVYGSSIYIFGGYDGLNRLNDFIKFDFGADDLSFDVSESTLLSDLKSFVDNEAMSDVTLIVEGEAVFAHKLMLTRCPYFHAMFMGEMMESSQSTIHIEEVRYSIFLTILEYLYTDLVTIQLEDAMELFVAADQFCIPRLKTMCEQRMLESITIDTAAHLFYLADMHCATSLKAKTLSFILKNFDCVSKTPSFEEMSRGNVGLVIEILRNR